MERIRLYHTGFQPIPDPDIRHGRKNADFGQGFYLTQDGEFSRRWAKIRKGTETYINEYELSLDGLSVRRFSRDEEWFSYISANRAGKEDTCPEDVIIGPIANDTIYNTWGILTSGILQRDQALAVLKTGPVYEQIVIKTDQARAALRYCSSQILSEEEIGQYRETVRAEEEAFQVQMGKLLEAWDLL